MEMKAASLPSKQLKERRVLPDIEIKLFLCVVFKVIPENSMISMNHGFTSATDTETGA